MLDPPPMPPLDMLVITIARRIGQPLPLHPYAMAVALGLKPHQRSGAVYALRAGHIVMDSRWPREERESLVARACAVFLLHRAGLLRNATQDDVAWLAERLCGHAVVADRTGIVPRSEAEALALAEQSA